MLKTTADENPGTWPQRLATVMAAYRMTVHKTTGITPNMAMLGRQVMMPAALIARPPEEPSLHRYRLCLIYKTPYVMLIVGFEMRPSRLRERKRRITTNVRTLCLSV